MDFKYVIKNNKLLKEDINTIEDYGHVVDEMVVLPMSKNEFKNIKEISEFFTETLIERKGKYYHNKKSIRLDSKKLFLFQYQNQIIAYGVAVENVKKECIVDDKKYEGYYVIDPNTVVYLEKPITSEMMKKMYPEFNRFFQAKQKIDASYLEVFFDYFSKLSFNISNVEFDEEVNEENVSELIEGAKKTITVNAYERNQRAKNECIKYYKGKNHGVVKCEICGFNFGEFYGNEYCNKIVVHHIKEISTIQKDYVVNPKTDLLPVCPNCHIILHSKKPALMPDDVRKMLKK